MQYVWTTNSRRDSAMLLTGDARCTRRRRGHTPARAALGFSGWSSNVWRASCAPLTQLRRRWLQRSIGPRCHALGARVVPACDALVVVDEVDAPPLGVDALLPPGRRRRRRWLVDLAASLLLFGGAAIGEPLTSAMENEHLDFTDRGHGKLARLVGQQAVSLEHGLVQAGPVV